MMRALWTGASGMNAQQLNVDTISNNIANVNTTGFKSERMEFKSLLYQTMTKGTVSADESRVVPTNLQVGHGVKAVAIARSFDTGSFQATENTWDFSIDGPAFFVVQKGFDENGDPNEVYTKNGAFKLATVEDGESLMLVTSDGYPVLDTEGEQIIFDNNTSDITVDAEGRFSRSNNGVIEDLDIQLDLVQFMNPQGLEAVGDSFFDTTAASGEAIQEVEGDVTVRSSIVQGFLEMSNVNIAQEMVDLIVAQRAYELNSKSITTSDEMLQQANQLKS
ncbi:MAG: flagellar basal-body rod protein FlgG [Lachnospirales bacterium]